MSNLQYTMIALILSYLICVFCYPFGINLIKKVHLAQEIRELGPKSHLKKSGTPTMGGMIFGIVLLVLTLFFSLALKINNWFSILLTLSFGLLGFLDDFLKVMKKENEGLKVFQKLFLQILLSIIFTTWAYFKFGTVLAVPFFGEVNFGLWYIPITFIAIIAITNAVNLSDGLDGLCSGLTAITMVFFLVVSLSYNNLALSIFSGTCIGACVSFLTVNAFPAKIFMGDTGSMGLGAALASVSIALHMEIFFIIAGFVFVLEALSVVIQVGYFKLSHGKRVFRMAPIHHHFELGGKKETAVVAMFYTWAVIALAFGLLLL